MIKAMVSIVKCEVETSPRVLVLRGAQLLKKKKEKQKLGKGRGQCRGVALGLRLLCWP